MDCMNALEISPTDKLSFTGPFTREVSTTLSLRNISNKSVYFKMKCTKPTEQRVTPNKGIIMPSEYIDVKIFIEPFREDPKSKDLKFLVQYLHSEDDIVIDSVDNVFNNYQMKIPHFLLKCDFYINPFDDGTSKDEDLFQEILKLRKENVSLKEEIESLNLALNRASNETFFKSTPKTGNELLTLRKPIESIEMINKYIISSFDKLTAKINLRKEAILKELIETKDKFAIEKQIQEKTIFHYQERLVRDTRALTDVTDNLVLDVQQSVNEFVLSKVDELSQHFPTDPMVYFEMDLRSLDSSLETYIILRIEKGLS